MQSFSGDDNLLILLQCVCEHNSFVNFTGGKITIID